MSSRLSFLKKINRVIAYVLCVAVLVNAMQIESFAERGERSVSGSNAAAEEVLAETGAAGADTNAAENEAEAIQKDENVSETISGEETAEGENGAATDPGETSGEESGAAENGAEAIQKDENGSGTISGEKTLEGETGSATDPKETSGEETGSADSSEESEKDIRDADETDADTQEASGDVSASDAVPESDADDAKEDVSSSDILPGDVEEPLPEEMMESVDIDDLLYDTPVIEGTSSEQLNLKLECDSSYSYNPATGELAPGSLTTFQITVTVTGTTVVKPVLEIKLPKCMDVTYYPQTDDATLKKDLASANPIEIKTDGSGNTVLTYRFVEKPAQVGFNLTVEIKDGLSKLKDDSVHKIEVNYYDGTKLLKKATEDIKIINRTMRKGYLSSNWTPTFTYYEGETDYDYFYSRSIGTNYYYENHYPYQSVRMFVILPKGSEVTPSKKEGEIFTELADGYTENYTDGYTKWSVTYRSNYSYSSADGTVSGTGRALIYDITADNFLKYHYSMSLYNAKSKIYLRFQNLDDGKVYKSNIRPRIECTIDDSTVIMQDYAENTGVEYATFVKFDWMSHVYVRSGTNSLSNNDSYVCSAYDGKRYKDNGPKKYYAYIENTAKGTLSDINVTYTFDEGLNTDKINFSTLGSSGYPTTAAVRYQTKKGGDEWFLATMDSANKVLTLTEDAFTKMEVVYDSLSQQSTYNTMFVADVHNYEGKDEDDYRTIAAEMTSVRYKGSAPVAITRKNTYYFQLKDKLPELYISSVTIRNRNPGGNATTLNKGDEFDVRVTPYSSYGIEYNNLFLCVRMPSAYIFTGYKPEGKNLEKGRYTVRSHELEGTGDTLHFVKFTDGVDYCGGSHVFSFRVGPEVDTSKVQTNVRLPKLVYASTEHELFEFTATYLEDGPAIGADVNGDGDREDFFYKMTPSSTATINSVNSLTAQSYVSVEGQAGENIDHAYSADAVGNYRLYLYNGFDSGHSVDSAQIDIPMPRAGESFTYDGKTYTPQWDVLLNGPVETVGDFLEDATILYSLDGGATWISADDVEDFSRVTHIRLVTAAGKSLANNKSAYVKFPFTVDFGNIDEDEEIEYNTYFNTQMEYIVSSSGGVPTNALIQSSKLTASPVEFSGIIFQDRNGNELRDASDEMVNDKTYTISLYYGEGTEGEPVKSISTKDDGSFSVGIVKLGTYTLHVEKSDEERYEYKVSGCPFDKNGNYTFTLASGEALPMTDNLNMGMLILRELEVDFHEVTLLGGDGVNDEKKVNPTLSIPLFDGEEPVSFESADPSVATVDADGTIRYAGAGSTVVTVKAPQLPAAVHLGEDEWLKQEIQVVCQERGCHMDPRPSVWADVDGAVEVKDSLKLELDIGGRITQELYYFYKDGGYCNHSAHTFVKDAAAVILDKGSTDAVISAGVDTTGQHKDFVLSVTRPGIIKLNFSRVWGHDEDNKPADILVTIEVVAKELPPPVYSISPEAPDGESGWYVTLPQIALAKGTDALGVDTWFWEGENGDRKKLTESDKPAVDKSGIYHFNARNTAYDEMVQSVVATLEECRVDMEPPVILDEINCEAVSMSSMDQIGNHLFFGNFFKEVVRISVKAEDAVSGVGTLYYTLPGKEIQSTPMGSDGQGSFDIPMDTEGCITFYVTDVAGNRSNDVVLRKFADGSDLWVIEERGPEWENLILIGINGDKGSSAADGMLWFREPVEATVDVTDAQSGLAWVVVSLNKEPVEVQFPTGRAASDEKQTSFRMYKVIEVEGISSLQVSAEDNAMNLSVTEANFGIDRKAPKITVEKKKAVDGMPTATVTIEDKGSGVVPTSIRVLWGGKKVPYHVTATKKGYLISFSIREEDREEKDTAFVVIAEDYVGWQSKLLVAPYRKGLVAENQAELELLELASGGKRLDRVPRTGRQRTGQRDIPRPDRIEFFIETAEKKDEQDEEDSEV